MQPMEIQKKQRTTLSPAPFDRLPDAVVEQILRRLPVSSVFGSRCVSKRWLSLTRSPYFLRLFEAHLPSSEKDRHLGLLLHDSLYNNNKEFVACSQLPQSKFPGFSLNFLPGFRLNGNDPITVMGSFEDLLLCSNSLRFQKDYFVVNPITRQWVALPRALRLYESVVTGFVCDPASIREAKNGEKLRYRVARIPVFEKSKTEFNVEIFSSEDGQWNEYATTWAEGQCTDLWRTRAIACNGSLYWLFKWGAEKIMVLDPFNPEKKEINVIETPSYSFDRMVLKEDNLGICGGKLRMSRTLRLEEGEYEPLHLKIWELEEEEHNGGAKWRSVHEVSLQEIAAENPSYLQLRDSTRGCRHESWRSLAFHPKDGDILYFGCTLMNKVICCNLKMRSVEVMGGYNNMDSGFAFWGAAIPFVLPWWPTRIPALPKLQEPSTAYIL